MSVTGPNFWNPTPQEIEAVERMFEELEILGNQCPYCGDADWLGHRIDHHPEMWIGGLNAYGTDFHDWADH